MKKSGNIDSYPNGASHVYTVRDVLTYEKRYQNGLNDVINNEARIGGIIAAAILLDGGMGIVAIYGRNLPSLLGALAMAGLLGYATHKNLRQAGKDIQTNTDVMVELGYLSGQDPDQTLIPEIYDTKPKLGTKR